MKIERFSLCYDYDEDFDRHLYFIFYLRNTYLIEIYSFC